MEKEKKGTQKFRQILSEKIFFCFREIFSVLPNSFILFFSKQIMIEFSRVRLQNEGEFEKLLTLQFYFFLWETLKTF